MWATTVCAVKEGRDRENPGSPEYRPTPNAGHTGSTEAVGSPELRLSSTLHVIDLHHYGPSNSALKVAVHHTYQTRNPSLDVLITTTTAHRLCIVLMLNLFAAARCQLWDSPAFA